MDLQERDEWLEEEEHPAGTLFEKKVINFENKVIQANVDKKMENPILNAPIEDFQNEEDAEENQNSEKMHDETKRNHSKETSKQQALYNPLEDEQNQIWLKKKSKKAKRPLSCPSCFAQLAYDYQIGDIDENGPTYICQQAFDVEVKQNKIIRQAKVSEKMEWSGVDSQTAETQLRERQQAFNIKIVVDCTCGHSVGYFDINKESYTLINVL